VGEFLVSARPAEAGSFPDALRREADAAWGVPAALAVAAVTLPFAGGLLVALSRLNQSLFVFLTAEDRLLEWLQFAGYAAAALFAGLVTRKLRRVGTRRSTIASWALFTLGCFLIAGEEISWGQRIFGWGTPEAFHGRNYQDETNVHNLGSVHVLVNVVLLAIGLYGTVAPFVARRLRLAGRSWLFIPPLFLVGAFFVVFLFKFGRFTFIPGRDSVVEWGEWPEFCLAFALVSFAGLSFRRLRVDSGPWPASRSAR
jgi:hypothetical protein